MPRVGLPKSVLNLIFLYYVAYLREQIAACAARIARAIGGAYYDHTKKAAYLREQIAACAARIARAIGGANNIKLYPYSRKYSPMRRAATWLPLIHHFSLFTTTAPTEILSFPRTPQPTYQLKV